jgi:hypothetical protein
VTRCGKSFVLIHHIGTGAGWADVDEAHVCDRPKGHTGWCEETFYGTRGEVGRYQEKPKEPTP